MKPITVFIKIQGLCGTGKTTIAVKLARILKEYGIPTEVWENNYFPNDDTSDDRIEKNLKALSPKIEVVIQTEQLKRICIP